MVKSSTTAKATIRCAIYTRKSSEEGLDQDFNSLDAQREACEAFISSQKQEGWTALPAFYDDGGLSGGDMKRPALTRLLADIEAGRIDTVVVYKVDRLTRSLADFAVIVELFDRHDVAFVAVTQQFNTTSLGRLTLNMLLSFAQFEREVTAERIRDKIKASKKKGLWMGGVPPLGYDIRDKKLVVNQAEAETVRHIFERYLVLGSVHALRDELAMDGIVSKRRTSRHGRASGGKSLARGALYRLLQNPIYRGEITHKGNSYPGKHEAIIDDALWDQVQARLAGNRVDRRTGTKAKQPSLLAGLVYDNRGERLVPTHANKKGTRYRYYVSQSLIKQRHAEANEGWRIPAADLEHLLEAWLQRFLKGETELFDLLAPYQPDVKKRRQIIARAATLAEQWTSRHPTAKKAVVQALINRLTLDKDHTNLQIRPDRLAEIVDPDIDPTTLPSASADQGPIVKTTIPALLQRSGGVTAFTIGGDSATPPDRSLLRLLAQAQRYRNIVMNNQDKSLRRLAAETGVARSYFNRVFCLAFLAPDITKAILKGSQPADLTAKRLSFDIKLDHRWDQQRKQLGFT